MAALLLKCLAAWVVADTKVLGSSAHIFGSCVGSCRLSYLALTATASTVELKTATRIIPTSPTPIAGLPSRVCKPQFEMVKAKTSQQDRSHTAACIQLGQRMQRAVCGTPVYQ